MKGTIVKIVENDLRQEFGFISSEGSDYYFDNRYLYEGTMADFYVDDIVEFNPGNNLFNPSQLVAMNVKLDLGEMKQHNPAFQKNSISPKNEYITPEQEGSKSDKWYRSGRSDKLVLWGFSDNECIILDKLSKVLYHTNAGHFKTRNKGIAYGYSLFGPTKQLTIQLGLEKVEFAMIFCDRNDFQRRTLEETFLYLTHYVIPKIRISGHFYVLVTQYGNIVSQIEKPEIQGALQCSVIPFSYNELLDTPQENLEQFLLTRFKKYLFERNFFSYSEPINDRLFLFGGREQFAKGIADRNISGDHSGIFGLRKSGKTSVINMVKQELEQREVFFMSYRCVEFICHDWYESLNKIVRDIYKNSDMEFAGSDYSASTAIERFSFDIVEYLSACNTSKIVLIFDEIEQISIDSTFDEKWQDATAFHMFWSAIITFCEKYPNTLSLIIAGINPSINELDLLPTKNGKVSPRNPIYKKLSNDNYLKPFVYEQTKRMVNDLGKYMRLKFDDETCFELQKDFGGHPYFTRQMCKTIVQYIRHNTLIREDDNNFTITRPLYTAVKSSGTFETESIQWCKDMLRELQLFYSSEYQLLLRIANRDITTIEQIRRSIAIIPHLIGYGLVKFDENSKEMEISIDIVRDFLIKEKVYKKPFKEMNKDEIDEEIQDGIALCEQPLRKLIRDVVTTQLSRTDAEIFIKATKSYERDNRQNSLVGLTVAQLLNPRMVILHFYVLKDIICSSDHYDIFKNKLYPYTRQEIDSYLSNLYVARNAADHHYEVHNEATLLNFRASLTEITKLLSDLGYIE